MARSLSPPIDTDKDYAQELQDFVAELYRRPECEAVASEIDGEAARKTCYVDDKMLNTDAH